jgi:DNA polymerase IV
MRVVCLLVEHLPTCAEVLLMPDIAARPTVVLRAWDRHVLDASPDATALGIGPGDSRHRVEQLCPQAVILPARESIYQAHHDSLRGVLVNFAGVVESGTLGEMFGEVTALARTFPSEKALALQLAAQAQRNTSLPAAVGIACNKFTALQAARQAATQSGWAAVVPEGSEGLFLASLPLSTLPDLPAEMLRRLHLLDITTLGELARLPHAAVIRQFGPEAALFHELARGVDPRPLAPNSPPPMVMHIMALPESLTDRRLVLVALEHLAGQVAREMERSGHHAQAISVSITTADGQQVVDGIAVKPPSADAALLRRLVGRLLGRATLASAVSELMLTAYPLREWHLGARQLTLFDEPPSPQLSRLQEVLRMLRRRFGEAVVQLASVIGPPLPLPIQVDVTSDGVPVQLRWGGWSRRVASIYEAWREQRRWWDQPVVRHYYQVETGVQAIFTVFQDAAGCWFLDRRRE